MDECLTQHQFALPQSGDLDPATLFDVPVRGIWLEVGFGTGEHLAEQARLNPDIGFIGCEPFVNGVAALLVKIEELGLQNVRIWPDDARLLLERLKNASLDRFFLLHPDPWPKTRHHKRRFIQQETLDIIGEKLKAGALLRMATDDPGLAEWLLEKTWKHPAFSWLAKKAADWRDRPADWPETRYEQKGKKADRPPVYLQFLRK